MLDFFLSAIAPHISEIGIIVTGLVIRAIEKRKMRRKFASDGKDAR